MKGGKVMGKVLDWLIKPLARAWEIEDSFSLEAVGAGRIKLRNDLIIGIGTALKADGRASLMSEAIAKKCVQFYKLWVAPRILLTGGYTCGGYTEAKAMQKILLVEGIPKEAIFLEEESFRTWMNAVESKKIMKQYGWYSAIVVTQHIYSRKVKATFEKIFKDSGINLYFLKAYSGYEKIPQRRWTSEARFLLTWEIPTYFYSKLKGWA